MLSYDNLTPRDDVRLGIKGDLVDGPVTLSDGSTVAWDCGNKKLPEAELTSTQSFTINMTNVISGSQGVLKIITSTASAITLTFDTDFTNKMEGSLGQETITTFIFPAATAKQYILNYFCLGTTIHWFISSNRVIDWSTGINPSGWSSFTTKWCFYIDLGTHVFIHGLIEGTGTGTTAGGTLPIALSSLYTGSSNVVNIPQTVNNTTVAAGLVIMSGGSAVMDFRCTVAGGAWQTATTRIVRFNMMYFK